MTSGICTSYKLELLQGIHSSADTYKIALYTAAAAWDVNTTAYSSANEVASAGGYTAGGKDLVGFNTGESNGTVWIDFTTDPSWPASTITARGAMIYNSSKANRAVCILDFGTDKSSSNGTLTVEFPTPDAANAWIRLT